MNSKNVSDAASRWIIGLMDRIEHHLEGLAQVLRSDRIDAKPEAARKILAALEWYEAPRTPQEIAAANQAQREAVRAELTRLKLPRTFVDRAAKQVTVRRAGRPRTRWFDAYAGLRLRWIESKEWREIVLEISGSCKERGCSSYCAKCEDVARTTKPGRLGQKRRQDTICTACHFRLRTPERKEQVCWKCSDAMADLVGRFERFLIENGIAQPPQR